MKTVHGRTVNISEGGISDLRLARTGGYTQNPGPRVDECKRDISTISEDGSSFTLAVSRKRPRRLGGHGGIILLGPDGRFGLDHNTPAMAWGLATPSGLQIGLTV